jgi:putative mRNA 3-end processing factor
MDRRFVLSDHADWLGLLSTIEATGAERIGVTHGYSDTLVRYLNEQQRDSWVVPTRYGRDEDATDEGGPESGSKAETDQGDS